MVNLKLVFRSLGCRRLGNQFFLLSTELIRWMQAASDAAGQANALHLVHVSAVVGYIMNTAWVTVVALCTTALYLFNGLFSGTTWVSRYEKGKTSQDFNEARDGRAFGMALASAGSYANSLHLAADR